MDPITSEENIAAPTEEVIQQWVREAKEGNEDSFARIIEVFAVRLQSILYRMLLNWDDAKDIAQETFIHAYRALPHYQPKSKFQSWLFQIGARQALDLLRKRKRRPISVEFETAKVDPPAEDKSVARHELGRAIELAIEQLPIDLRTAFVLSEYEGQGYREIAEVIGGSAKSVEMKLYRARQILREQLKGYLE